MNQSANQPVLLIKDVCFITITPIVIVTSVFIMQETQQISCKEQHVRVKWFCTGNVTHSIVKSRLTVAQPSAVAPPPPQTTPPRRASQAAPPSTASVGCKIALLVNTGLVRNVST